MVNNTVNTVNTLAELRASGAVIQSVGSVRGRVFITLLSASNEFCERSNVVTENRRGAVSVARVATINNCVVYWGIS